jgi:hypothetical protein
MKDADNIRRFRVDCDRLPAQFPTHLHPSAFCPCLSALGGEFVFQRAKRRHLAEREDSNFRSARTYA